MSFQYGTLNLTYSQGRVKFPIGGIPDRIWGARERFSLISWEEDSRTGEKPVPTVTVWMEEDKTVRCIYIYSGAIVQ